ncbi:MAG TPA: hypothetical protein VLW52_00795 [Opitutaceae bacterium]|nr:hypothetical protein [Opitutaceae bacterium]
MNDTTDTLLSSGWGVGLLALLEILLVVGVFALGARTELVRDADAQLPDFRQRPFSLGKSQLAFWTVAVIGSFLYVFFATGRFAGVMTNTVLWLLGISSGTAALSAAAGGPSAPAAPSPAAPPAPAAAPAPPQVHQTFFTDILSDRQGMNVHRLQMVIWTAAFGGIFVYESIKTGIFPTFDDQAFVLMGISSVTYVWFKRGEV